MRASRFIMAVLSIMLLSSGCIVISVYPYYSEDQIRFDESLVGTWDTGEGEYWEFSKKDDDRYLITIIDDEVIGIMEGILFDYGGYTFMDMYPWDFEYKQVINAMDVLVDALGDSASATINYSRSDIEESSEMDLWWNNMHLMPTHSVLRFVKKDADTIELGMMDVDWLSDQLQDNPGLIKYEIPGGNSRDDIDEGDAILLTASTKELQPFIAKYAENEDVFEMETLTRINKK